MRYVSKLVVVLAPLRSKLGVAIAAAPVLFFSFIAAVLMLSEACLVERYLCTASGLRLRCGIGHFLDLGDSAIAGHCRPQQKNGYGNKEGGARTVYAIGGAINTNQT